MKEALPILSSDETMNRVNAYLACCFLASDFPTCDIHKVNLLYNEIGPNADSVLMCPFCRFSLPIPPHMTKNSARQLMRGNNVSRNIISNPQLAEKLAERLNDDEIVS